MLNTLCRTLYQAQFNGASEFGPGGTGEPANPRTTTSDGTSDVTEVTHKEKPHVFQTIFLDRETNALWTKDEIDPSEIIAERWWKQQSHRWQHCEP